MISLHEGRGPGPQKTDDRMIQLRLSVAGCRPPIWRRVQVKESMWLSQLHDTIQLIFDWYDYQTHAFAIGGHRYGNPLKRDDFVIDDDRDITLADVDLPNQTQLSYGYHFGEGWHIEFQVESVGVPEKGAHYPRVIAGERAGPPEDCGGMDAFHDMLVCIQEPHTELGREWLDWLGPDYDAERCDLDAMNKALKKLGK
jgi:hypothetical protein